MSKMDCGVEIELLLSERNSVYLKKELDSHKVVLDKIYGMLDCVLSFDLGEEKSMKLLRQAKKLSGWRSNPEHGVFYKSKHLDSLRQGTDDS